MSGGGVLVASSSEHLTQWEDDASPAATPCEDWPSFRRYTATARPWRDFFASSRLLPIPVPRPRPPSSPLGHLSEELPELFAAAVVQRHGKGTARVAVMVSRVCKAWRHIVKDPHMWKCLCVRAWGESIGCLRAEMNLVHGSWRAMYLGRPRVRTDGVYCCQYVVARRGVDEGSGIREGETSANRSYKPMHWIPVYRLIQFKQGGVAAFLTTTADVLPPALVLKTLRKAWALRSDSPDASPAGAVSGPLAPPGGAKPRRNTKSAGGRGRGGAGCVQARTWTVSFAEWTLGDGGEVDMASTYVLPSHPLMKPIRVEMRLGLSSSRLGANDTLTVQKHTAGSLEMVGCSGGGGGGEEEEWLPAGAGLWDVKADSNVYRFAASEGFGRRVEAMGGWNVTGVKFEYRD